MKKQNILLALTALVGVIILGSSYGIDPGTPKNATPAQWVAFGYQHAHAVLWMSWMQLVGTFLILVFALALVRLTNTMGKLPGILTLFGASFFMTVSSMEVVFYMGTIYGSPQNIALICLDLIHSIQHLYFIIAAPAVFIPLGCVILLSPNFPRWLGYLAVLFGVTFGVLGITSLYILVLPTSITVLASIQSIWWLLAAFLCLRLKGVEAS